GCYFLITHFLKTSIVGSDFSQSHFGRSSWNGSRVRGVSFRSASVDNARLDEAELVECDFGGAQLNDTEPFMELCTTRRTRFERCDLRGTSWQGRLLEGTVFDHCRMHGILGKPTLGGPITVVAPDYSEAGDGSDVRADGELPEAWRIPE